MYRGASFFITLPYSDILLSPKGLGAIIFALFALLFSMLWTSYKQKTDIEGTILKLKGDLEGSLINALEEIKNRLATRIYMDPTVHYVAVLNEGRYAQHMYSTYALRVPRYTGEKVPEESRRRYREDLDRRIRRKELRFKWIYMIPLDSDLKKDFLKP